MIISSNFPKYLIFINDNDNIYGIILLVVNSLSDLLIPDFLLRFSIYSTFIFVGGAFLLSVTFSIPFSYFAFDSSGINS